MAVSQFIDKSVVALFSVWLPKGTVLYKGQPEPSFNFNAVGPCWFSLSESEATKYGPNVVKVTTTKKLLLLNANSRLFSLHFTDYINLKQLDNREDLLLPLGIPDLETQEARITQKVKEQGKTPPENNCKNNTKLKQTIKYYEGHSRYSGTQLDHNMAMEMQDAYGPYVQGYMQPTDRPSCWHVRFPSEVCIFNIGNVEFKEGPIQRRQKGGGKAAQSSRTVSAKPQQPPADATEEVWPGLLPRQEMTPTEWRQYVTKYWTKQGKSAYAIKKFLATGSTTKQ
jgi:hypothetical protein